VAAFCGFLVPTLSAAPLINNSVLHFSGDATVGALATTFLCNQPGDPSCFSAPAGTGDFAVSSSTGSFAQYNGTFGLAKSFNNAVQPLNALFTFPNFLTFTLNNNITIELTFIPLGTNPLSSNCSGLTNCTFQNPLLITPSNPQGISAFNLNQNQNGTTASFSIFGIVHESGGGTGSLSGTYSAQFAGLNPQEALAAMLGGQAKTFDATLQLTVAEAVPEPATIFLTCVGLLGLGTLSRRRR